MSSSYLPGKKLLLTIASLESLGVRVGSGLLFCLLLLGIPRSAPGQARWIPTGNTDRYQAFVVAANERGEIACRAATSDERRNAAARNGGGPMRTIYSGAPRRKEMPFGTEAWTSDETRGLVLKVSAGLRIVLHGTSQLEQN